MASAARFFRRKKFEVGSAIVGCAVTSGKLDSEAAIAEVTRHLEAQPNGLKRGADESLYAFYGRHCDMTEQQVIDAFKLAAVGYDLDECERIVRIIHSR